MNPQMMAEAQKMMAKMSPDDIKRMQEMAKNMDPNMMRQMQQQMTSNPAMMAQAARAMETLTPEQMRQSMEQASQMTKEELNAAQLQAQLQAGSSGMQAAPPPVPPKSAVDVLKASSVPVPPSVLDAVDEAERLKLTGNKRFQAQDFDGAVAKYDLALKALAGSTYDSELSASNLTAVRALADTCLANSAQCHLKKGANGKAVEACSAVLERSPAHRKALYYRGKAYLAQADYKLAVADLKAAHRFERGDATVKATLDEAVAARKKAQEGQEGLGVSDEDESEDEPPPLVAPPAGGLGIAQNMSSAEMQQAQVRGALRWRAGASAVESGSGGRGESRIDVGSETASESARESACENERPRTLRRVSRAPARAPARARSHPSHRLPSCRLDLCLRRVPAARGICAPPSMHPLARVRACVPACLRVRVAGSGDDAEDDAGAAQGAGRHDQPARPRVPQERRPVSARDGAAGDPRLCALACVSAQLLAARCVCAPRSRRARARPRARAPSALAPALTLPPRPPLSRSACLPAHALADPSASPLRPRPPVRSAASRTCRPRASRHRSTPRATSTRRSSRRCSR
jgi:tetratricopeptide (TPR) repeat protein